jgi:hypothetical protein
MKQLINEIENMFKKENLTEGLIIEKKLDSVIRTLVKDIIYILKNEKDGEFELPSELYPEKDTYNFVHFMNEFTVELNIIFLDDLQNFMVDGNYYNEEDVLEINIEINPSNIKSQLQSIIGPLNELIAHELTHIKQHERGYQFPENEPELPIDYYSQEHELEAQKRGFARRAKKEKRSIESVIDDWFENNRSIHNLSQQEKEELIKKIVNYKFN